MVLDSRKSPVFQPTAKPFLPTRPRWLFRQRVRKEVTVTASGEYTVGAAPAGFEVEETETGVTISAEANDTGNAKSGTLTITLNADNSKTAKITISQAKQGA